MKKYRQYLLPSILTSLALALNEFVDCMVISNLLGNDGLAVASLACPVILFIAACYVILGSGGSTFYAVLLGKWESERAGKVFRMSMIMAVGTGLLLLAFGWIFGTPLVALFCPDEVLRPAFSTYFHTLLYTAPILTAMLTFVWFLPPSGAPVVATVVNIVSNCLNLVMDFVYIRIFGMGVEGAAWATATGYLIGMVVMVVMIRVNKVRIANEKVGFKDLSMALTILALGSSTSALQICFAIKYAFSNGLAASYGGRMGVVAFSLCLQTFSLASVFLLGVADTAQPLFAMLRGQKDYVGEGVVLRRSLSLQLIFSVVLVILLECFPQAVTAAYKVQDPETLELALKGIRIFSLSYLFRSVCIQFMRFFQVEGKTRYALFISFFDGLAVMPIILVLCGIMGIDGLFLAYPVASLILLIVILAINAVTYKKNPEQYTGVLLLQKDLGSVASLNLTIADKPEEISAASEKMIDFARENKVPGRQAFRLGLVCEEMAVYTQNHRKEPGEIDLLLRILKEELILNFRSIGAPFNPMQGTEEDLPENIILLQKTASQISYDYIMGMNSTRIVVAIEEEKPRRKKQAAEE